MVVWNASYCFLMLHCLNNNTVVLDNQTHFMFTISLCFFIKSWNNYSVGEYWSIFITLVIEYWLSVACVGSVLQVVKEAIYNEIWNSYLIHKENEWWSILLMHVCNLSLFSMDITQSFPHLLTILRLVKVAKWHELICLYSLVPLKWHVFAVYK